MDDSNAKKPPRPFLKRGTGLLRFYKNGTPESPAPTPTNPKPKARGRNLNLYDEPSETVTAAAIPQHKILREQNGAKATVKAPVVLPPRNNSYEQNGAVAADPQRKNAIKQNEEKAMSAVPALAPQSRNVSKQSEQQTISAVPAAVPQFMNEYENIKAKAMSAVVQVETIAAKSKIRDDKEPSDSEDAEPDDDGQEYSEWESVDGDEDSNCEPDDLRKMAPVPIPLPLPTTPAPTDPLLSKLNETLLDEELRLFELMENFTSKLSFCSTSSTIQRFVNSQSPKIPKKLSPAGKKVIFDIGPEDSDIEEFLQVPIPDATTSEDPINSDVLRQVFDMVRKETDHYDDFEIPQFTTKNDASPPSNFEDVQLPPAPERTKKPSPNTTEIQKLCQAVSKLQKNDSTSLEFLRKILQLQDFDLNSGEFDFDASEDLENSTAPVKAEEVHELRKTITRLQKELTFRKSNERKLQSTITSLNSQISELQNSQKVQISRWASSSRAQKQSLEKLKSENQALKTEIENIRKRNLEKEIREARLRSNRILQNQQQKPKENLAPQPPVGSGTGPSSTRSESETQKPGVEPESQKPEMSQQKPEIAPKSQTLEINPQKSPPPPLGFAPANTVKISETADPKTGDKVVTYQSGTQRVFDDDGNCVKILYSNGDVKDSTQAAEGVIKYYFKAADLWQTTYADGKEVLEFPSGEIQTNYPSTGYSEILYPDKTLRKFHSNGTEETIYPDKTLVAKNSKRGPGPGNQTLHLPNGQIEIQGQDYNCRIYPDGTEKILYPNGSTLTRYAGGRQRFKDANGKLVYDHVVPSKNQPNEAS